MKPQRYAIKVVWKDGSEDYVFDFMTSHVSTFTSRARAQQRADFLAEGMDDAQSINVVLAPVAATQATERTRTK